MTRKMDEESYVSLTDSNRYQSQRHENYNDDTSISHRTGRHRVDDEADPQDSILEFDTEKIDQECHGDEGTGKGKFLLNRNIVRIDTCTVHVARITTSSITDALFMHSFAVFSHI